MKRLYLDTCCLQRPFDNQGHPRIRVETEAVFAILAVVQSGDLRLLNSEVLEFEIRRIPDPNRQLEAISMLELASEYVLLSPAIEELAVVLQAKGISAMDALHVATASVAGVDYFCTTDDRLFRKIQGVQELGCKVITLLNLVLEIK